jgi:hypothetical protein
MNYTSEEFLILAKDFLKLQKYYHSLNEKVQEFETEFKDFFQIVKMN